MDLSSEKNLISTKEASKLTGYVSDYISRLCRQGKIEAEQVGRTWLIDRNSLLKFVDEDGKRKEENARALAHAREQEYQAAKSLRETELKTQIISEPIPPAQPEPQQEEEPNTSPTPTPYYPVEIMVRKPRAQTRAGIQVHGSLAALAVTLTLVAAGAYAGHENMREAARNSAVALSHVVSAEFSKHTGEAQTPDSKTIIAAPVLAEPIKIGHVITVTAVDAKDEASTTRLTFASHETAVVSEANTTDSSFKAFDAPRAFGSLIVALSDSIIGAYERGIDVWVNVAREIPPSSITFVHSIGFSTASFAATAPREIPATMDDAENIALGIVGNVALVYDNARAALQGTYAYAPGDAAREPEHADSIYIKEEQSGQARELLAAAGEPEAAYTAGEEAALSTYHFINSLFKSASDSVVSLFAPKPPAPAPRPIVITSISPSVPATTPGLAYTSSPSVPANYYTVNGLTEEEILFDVVYPALGRLDDRVHERLLELEEELRDDLGGGAGTVTSVAASGGTTGLSFTGSPITTSGTLTLTGTLDEANGGTGLSTAPTYGQLLVGNSSGGYTLTATSSLGITGTSNTFTYPLVDSGGTVSLAFGTTTANTWSALQTFSYASTTGISASYASSTSAFFGALSVGSLDGPLQANAGVVSATTSVGVLYGGTGATTASGARTNLGAAASGANSDITSLSGLTTALSVPQGGTGWGTLQSNAVLLGNGTGAIATTTAGTNGQVLALVGGVPTWVATTTLANISGTLGVASGGTGSTTLSGILRGNGTSQVSTVVIGSGLTFDGTTLATAGGGITSIGPAGQGQTGGTITFATSSTAYNGLTASTTITGSGDTITFANTLAGILGVAGGGTGAATFTNNRLITGNGTSALVDEANLTFDGSTFVVTGNATTSQLTVSSTLYVPSLSNGCASIASGILTSTGVACGTGSGGITSLGAAGQSQTGASQTFATSTGSFNGLTLGTTIVSSTDTHTFTPSITGTLTVAGGGTGWGTLQSNAVLLGNGIGAIATTTAGTNGQVLALVSGVPTWTATTTAGTGLTYSGGAFNVNTSQNIATLSNLTTDGVIYTSGSNGTLNVDSGALDVARGGTGATSFTQGSVVFSNGTTLTQSNSNFFWSTINNFLGLGTSSPASRLAVSGGATIGADYNLAAPTNGLLVEGNTGIGTTSPAQALSVGGNVIIGASAAGGTNGTLTYGGVTAANTVTGTGSLVLGTSPTLTTLTVSSGGIAVTGNSTITGTLGSLTGITSSGTITFSGLTADRLVTTTTGGALTTSITSANVAASVTNETGSGLLVFATGPTISGATVDTSDLILSGTASNVRLGSNFLSGDGGDEGVSVSAAGVVSTSGDLSVGGGTGKITVGTIDPVYSIDGVNYATYVTGMIGVKEEVVGTADVLTPMTASDGTKGYVSVLDFDSQEEGSDLWLFAQATHLRKNIGDMIVLLTAQQGAKVWYEIDEEERKVYLLSNQPTKISYRLTAPRFDADEWTNFNHDAIAGFNPPSGDDLSYFDEEDIQFSFDPSSLFSGTTTLATLIEEAENDEDAPWAGGLSEVSDGLKEAMDTLADAVIHAFEGVQYFADGIFKRIFAGEVYTDKICITDESGSTCLTRAELDALLAGAGAAQASGGDEGDSGSLDDGGNDTNDTEGGDSGDSSDGISDTNGDSSDGSGDEGGTDDTGGDSSGETGDDGAGDLGDEPGSGETGDEGGDTGGTDTGESSGGIGDTGTGGESGGGDSSISDTGGDTGSGDSGGAGDGSGGDGSGGDTSGGDSGGGASGAGDGGSGT